MKYAALGTRNMFLQCYSSSTSHCSSGSARYLDLTEYYIKSEKHVIIQFSCSVMSDSLQPHGLQYARPPCPSPTPRVYSNSCPLSQWCHPTIYYITMRESWTTETFKQTVPTWFVHKNAVRPLKITECSKELAFMWVIPIPGGWAYQVVLVVKTLSAREVLRDMGSISGLGRTPGGGHGNPL